MGAIAASLAYMKLCPLEAQIEQALKQAGIKYTRDSGATKCLDFYLPDFDVYLEIKGGHSDRISRQMARAHNVIAIQGVKSAQFVFSLLVRK